MNKDNVCANKFNGEYYLDRKSLNAAYKKAREEMDSVNNITMENGLTRMIRSTFGEDKEIFYKEDIVQLRKHCWLSTTMYLKTLAAVFKKILEDVYHCDHSSPAQQIEFNFDTGSIICPLFVGIPAKVTKHKKPVVLKVIDPKKTKTTAKTPEKIIKDYNRKVRKLQRQFSQDLAEAYSLATKQEIDERDKIIADNEQRLAAIAGLAVRPAKVVA